MSAKSRRLRKQLQRAKKKADVRKRHHADLGCDARWERGDVKFDGEFAGKRARAASECRLDLLLGMAVISQGEHDAGMKVREYWWAAHKAPKVTAKAMYVSEPGIEDHEIVIVTTGEDDGDNDGKELWLALTARLSVVERDAVIATCGLDSWAPLMVLRPALRKLMALYHIREKIDEVMQEAA